jgi:hypothetical protein
MLSYEVISPLNRAPFSIPTAIIDIVIDDLGKARDLGRPI